MSPCDPVHAGFADFLYLGQAIDLVTCRCMQVIDLVVRFRFLSAFFCTGEWVQV